MVTVNQETKTWPKAKPTPDNIKTYQVKHLSYCDPEVRGANYVMVNTSLQPEADNLVLAVRDGKLCVRRFKEITENDYVGGVVTQAN